MRLILRGLVAAAAALMFFAAGVDSASAACAAPGSLAAMRSQFTSLINAERAKSGLPALAANGKLQNAAKSYSCVMATTGKMSHNADGKTPGARATAAGFAWKKIAENVGVGQTTAAAIFAAWMASPGHKANMMLPDVKVIGLGAGSTGGNLYWDLLLAK